MSYQVYYSKSKYTTIHILGQGSIMLLFFLTTCLVKNVSKIRSQAAHLNIVKGYHCVVNEINILFHVS